MIYGPNTPSVQAIIDRIPTLTEDECNRLGAAWSAAWSASWADARTAAWTAARDATRDASRTAARDATRDASRDAIRGADWYAAWYAIIAAVTYDLAAIDGPYTIVQRDLLMTPWVEVCGMPEGLIATAALDGEG